SSIVCVCLVCASCMMNRIHQKQQLMMISSVNAIHLFILLVLTLLLFKLFAQPFCFSILMCRQIACAIFCVCCCSFIAKYEKKINKIGFILTVEHHIYISFIQLY